MHIYTHAHLHLCLNLLFWVYSNSDVDNDRESELVVGTATGELVVFKYAFKAFLFVFPPNFITNKAPLNGF